MSEKKRYVVRVYSQDVPVKSSEAEEYINSLAEYVDFKMNMFSSGNKISFGVLSILTSISITDELFKLKQTLENQIKGENKMKDELSASLAKVMMLEAEIHEKTKMYDEIKDKVDRIELELQEKEKLLDDVREKFNVISYELKKKPEERDVEIVLEETEDMISNKNDRIEKKHSAQLDIESLLL